MITVNPAPVVGPLAQSLKIEPVLLIHGTFANTRSNGDVGWWQPGSEFCGKMDALLRKERAAARCWADKTTFAWTGKNSELARHEAGRALALQLANLEEDKMIERYHLIGHSHGGNVILNALRDLPSKPGKLGAVLFMGTPILSFRHREWRDSRWIAIPLYIAALAGLSHFWSSIDSFSANLVLMVEAHRNSSFVRRRDGAGGRRLEADGCAVSQRVVEAVGQDEEPGERGSAPGARGGVALDPPMVIRCMNSAASLGQSRHVACASGCISIRTSLEEGIKLHRFAGMLPEQFFTEAGRHREAVVAADQRMVIRCFRDDLAGFVHDVSHVPPPIQRAGLVDAPFWRHHDGRDRQLDAAEH
jgi:pimeloyl-ACP methyl ester carboxylesterase